MKNLLIGICVVFLSIFGCKDDEPKLENSINIEDLIGTWVSVDSFITRDSAGEYFYSREVIEIDTAVLPLEYTPYIPLKPYCVRKVLKGLGYYSISLFADSLQLKYMGPSWLEIPDDRFKVFLSKNRDSLHLQNFKDCIPNGLFDKFIKHE